MTLSPVATLPLLALTAPLPGFPGHTDYALLPADGEGRLFWLQSLAPEGPRFVAVDPTRWFPDYAPVLPSAACAGLGVDDPAEARLYCLVTVPPAGPAAATANLRAPIVVDPATWRATQVVLADAAHQVRRPLRR